MLNPYKQSRRDLALWFTLSMGSILVVFAALLYGLGVWDRLLAFDAELENRARVIAAGSRYQLHQGKLQVKLDQAPVLGSKSLSLETELAYARWYNSQGDLARFMILAPANPKLQTLGFKTLKVKDAKGQSLWLRQVTLPVQQNRKIIGYVEIAAPLTAVQQQLDRQRFWLSLGVPLGLGAISLTGWWLGGLAMQPLKQSHERLESFTTHTSHELRTPLAQVLSHAQLALEPGVDGVDFWRLERIVAITKTMSHLVADLLFLARHQGSLNLEKLQTLDLRELLQELVWDQESIAEAKQIDLNCELPCQPVWVQADPDLLHQALLNLVNNALKYTPYGGQVYLQLEIRSSWALVQIIDNGPGIPATALPHLFEQFYRVPTTSPVEGFGLGLAIAEQIAEAHGGKITVTSTVGQGACFELSLPTS